MVIAVLAIFVRAKIDRVCDYTCLNHALGLEVRLELLKLGLELRNARLRASTQKKRGKIWGIRYFDLWKKGNTRYF